MTGPPFAPHPTGADSIHAHAEGLAIYAGGSYRLAGEVRHAFAAARSAVSGELDEPMLDAPRRFYETSDELHLATMYAAGCITLFADAVREFDDGVRRLNAEWATAANDFGVAPRSPDAARTPHGVDPGRLGELEADWTAAADTARRELAVDLRRRHHRLEGRLDDAAHDVAMQLRRGPTHDGVRALVWDGAFRQLYGALEQRLFQLTPDRPTAIETLQESGTPYICDDMGCRPTYTYPGSEDGGSEFGTFGDFLAGTIGGFTETADLLIPNEVSVPTFAPPPNPAASGYTVDLPDQPLTDPYEDLVRKVGANPDSDLYTVGTWAALPNAAGATKLGVKLPERILLRYARRMASHEAIDAAEDATKLVPGGGLAAHEVVGGHTLAKHVGKADQDLIQRVLTDPTATRASSFTDRAAAERAIADVLDANDAKIKAWLAGSNRRLELEASTNEVLGRYVDRHSLAVRDVSSLRVAIFRDESLNARYYIKTSFPKP